MHLSPAVRYWLLCCLLLVAAMVFVGGYTRLSGSGLSITEWKPVHGVIPPLNETQWQEEFDAYRATPQYEKINRGMTLGEFKTIYWPEYFHRLLGRAIGFVFLVPLLIFTIRKNISYKLAIRLTGIFALGGVQGFIGWYMVKSGLVNDPHVSHLRLALHLSIAFAIFGLLLWTWLEVLSAGCRVQSNHILNTQHSALSTYLLWFTLLCVQIIFGALVAGLHAGLVYNTWPLMNGEFLPVELWAVSPWYENHALVQFIHRNLALVVFFGFFLWWYLHRTHVKKERAVGVASALVLQIVLGIFTLLNAAPLPLALAHQMAALLLFGAAVVLMHGLNNDRLRKDF